MAEADDLAHDVKKSSRNPETLRARMREWLATRLPAGANPVIGPISSPTAAGMSSETLLFDAHWAVGGERVGGSFVGRLAPDPADIPIFPTYDMELQYRVIELVGQHSKVPVPRSCWLELDPAWLDCSFFIMERVEGRVPADNPPYAAAGWLKDATPAQRAELRENTLRAIADLHAIEIGPGTGIDTSFLEFDLPGDTPLRRHFENQKQYYRWAWEGKQSWPIIERTFEWLEKNWPEDEGPGRISWGDSRIANCMYAEDGFAPVAVLDWEMASIAPRGADIGWLIFMHDFFENILSPAGIETLPDLFPPGLVAETYERLSGHALPDLDWYRAYGGLRHAIIMSRVVARGVHFGQMELPADIDDAIPHRPFLEAVLSDGDWRS